MKQLEVPFGKFIGLDFSRATGVNGSGGDAELILHRQTDARRAVLLHLVDGYKEIAVFVGVVQIEGRENIAAEGDGETRIFFPLSEIVGVFKLDIGGSAQKVAGFPVHLQKEFLQRLY